jgi:hypothetical protein
MRTTSAYAGASLLLSLYAGLSFGQAPAANASFFVTSENPGNGGDLGGLAGADAHCQALAGSAGMGDKTWHAYLSTSTVDARDRIGGGPWYNVDGVLIAADLEQLHTDNKIVNETALDEHGDMPPYFVMVDGAAQRPDGLAHDILTGTNDDGTANEATCSNWTDGSAGSTAMLGHADRIGQNPGLNSWLAVHASRGCDMASLIPTGGAGLFYCFAVD